MELFEKSLAEYFETSDSDVIFYMGGICREGYNSLSEQLSPRDKDVLLIIGTLGGDPHAGYRIARAIRHNYKDKKLTVAIPGYCKSAGTLICIGASELVVSDKGELGPLDVQISKPDELFELSSGLDIIQALDFLNTNAMDSFKRYLIEIKVGSGITTRMASNIARKFASELYAPIFGHIDPVRLGEIQRAMLIAQAYGQRLDKYAKNLKNNALSKLMASYPDHGFVIDRREARDLFKNVREPSHSEHSLMTCMYNTSTASAESPKVLVCHKPQVEQEDSTDGQNDNKPESTDETGQGS